MLLSPVLHRNHRQDDYFLTHSALQRKLYYIQYSAAAPEKEGAAKKSAAIKRTCIPAGGFPVPSFTAIRCLSRQQCASRRERHGSCRHADGLSVPSCGMIEASRPADQGRWSGQAIAGRRRRIRPLVPPGRKTSLPAENRKRQFIGTACLSVQTGKGRNIGISASGGSSHREERQRI